MAWTVPVSGAQAATVGTEHTLAGTGDSNDLPVGSLYQLSVDLSVLAAGDTVEIRTYTKARDSDTLREYDMRSYSGAQSQPGTRSEPMAAFSGIRFTLKQTFGTGRTFAWAVGKQA